MTDWHEPVVLGRTGLSVGRIGFGSSYPAPAAAYEAAFERGLNYFYWGTRRRDSMARAIQTIAARHRAGLVVVIQSYARLGFLLTRSFEKALKELGLEHADVLLLGLHNQPPPARIYNAAERLVERGLVRHLALSSHRRTLFPLLMDDARLGILHARYNAVHRGAEQEIFPALAQRPKAERPGMVTFTTTRWGHLCDRSRTPPGEPTPTGADCHRFVLSDPRVDVALSGPSTTEHVNDVLRALDRGPMDPDELGWMRRVGDHIYGRDRTSGLRDGTRG